METSLPNDELWNVPVKIEYNANNPGENKTEKVFDESLIRINFKI